MTTKLQNNPKKPAAGRINVHDKYDGDVIGQVPSSSQADVRRAIADAQEAFRSYSEFPAHRRAKILENASDLITQERNKIAALICREAGKAWKYSLIEADRAAETFKFASEEAKRIHGETIPLDASSAGEGRFGFYIRTPIGVVAAISPFNFPLNLVAHKVAPALAAGNTVVLKPATSTPLTAFKLRDILTKSGLPESALRLVVGNGSTVGNWLVTDPRPAMVTFTGSPGVGQDIMGKAGLKKTVMELGNNGGVIIEPDSDWRANIERCAMSAFANSGQVCLSLQRIYIHRSIAQEFTRLLAESAAGLKVGNPLDKDCDVGPMISEAEALRAQSWIAEARGAGAEIVTGGKREGALLWPTVLAGVKPDMKVMCQEVFAPVVCIMPYDDFDRALAMLDDSDYGLQSGIFTNDLSKVMRAIKRVNVGGLMINDTSIFRVDHMPYGGNKLSGLGREGVRYAVEEMTNIRMIVIKT